MKISAHKAQCHTLSRCNSIDVVVPFQVMLDVNAQVSVSLCFLQYCVSKGVVGYDCGDLEDGIRSTKHLPGLKCICQRFSHAERDSRSFWSNSASLVQLIFL